jgi:branched-chain amino acid aminotransferase
MKKDYAFGKLFTDHMLSIDWTKANGWEKPEIIPYGPVKMQTSATALHYGISVHEGISVLENSNTGKLQAFRADEHMQAFYDSTEHLDLPLFDKNELLSCVKDLVLLDKDWLKQNDDPDQFYTRMVHFATDKTLGVRTPHATKILAMVNPVMLKSKDVTLKCSTNVNKNWPLGHGQYRLSGNLGPLVPSVTDAKMNGFDDVLWLLDDYIKEMTILNVFILQTSRYGHLELLTPPDDGCILNGVTRQTILDMKDDIKAKLNVNVEERQVSIHELINSDKEGRLLSVFGVSTHCPILNVSRICYRDTTMNLDMTTGIHEVRALNDMLIDVMQGDNKWITKFE